MKAFEQKFRDFMYLLRSKSKMWKDVVLVDMLSYICGRYPKVINYFQLIFVIWLIYSLGRRASPSCCRLRPSNPAG